MSEKSENYGNLIIAGSRDFNDYELLREVVDKVIFEAPNLYVKRIVSGAAKGADRLGERYARENGLEILSVPANWDEYGRAAGPIRNREMAKMSDALIALWDGKSRGTKNMIVTAIKEGLRVYIYNYIKKAFVETIDI